MYTLLRSHTPTTPWAVVVRDVCVGVGGGSVWLCVAVCGCVWLCVWLCVAVCGAGGGEGGSSLVGEWVGGWVLAISGGGCVVVGVR